jgi:ParB-like chromosome segregation protein Spo0J
VLYKTQGSPFVALLQLYLGEWKEELVDAKGETRDELQGTIKRVRALLADISRADRVREDKGKDGAYTG